MESLIAKIWISPLKLVNGQNSSTQCDLCISVSFVIGGYLVFVLRGFNWGHVTVAYQQD